MNLLELTDPLFQYVCRLNRVARKAATIDYRTARAEMVELFEEMGEKSKADHRLAQQYEKIEPALVYFVDSIVSESHLSFAPEWNANRLAFERQELAGDQVFFILLDETLQERGDDAAERLTVFYTCLGLGFSGWLIGQPEMLRQKMTEIAPRIRAFIESDDAKRICPAAYDHVNTANLPLPVGTRLIGIAIVFFGLILVVVTANIYLFRTSSADLYRALEEIAKRDAPAAQR